MIISTSLTSDGKAPWIMSNLFKAQVLDFIVDPYAVRVSYWGLFA